MNSIFDQFFYQSDFYFQPPVSSNNEEIKRVESPATGRLRRGNPSVNQPQMNSPRQPRRPVRNIQIFNEFPLQQKIQHPYVNQQRGYLGPGSSPSSPIATQPVNQRTSSLPSSPQQPKQDETLKTKNNCLSPSPVPEIVLTPSGKHHVTGSHVTDKII